MLDALGSVLTTRKMSLYTLEQAAQDVLGRVVEVLPPEALGTMWQTGDSGGASRVQRACFGQAALGLELCQALQLEHDAVQMAFVSKCSYEACLVIVVVSLRYPLPCFFWWPTRLACRTSCTMHKWLRCTPSYCSKLGTSATFSPTKARRKV